MTENLGFHLLCAEKHLDTFSLALDPDQMTFILVSFRAGRNGRINGVCLRYALRREGITIHDDVA